MSIKAICTEKKSFRPHTNTVPLNFPMAEFMLSALPKFCSANRTMITGTT